MVKFQSNLYYLRIKIQFIDKFLRESRIYSVSTSDGKRKWLGAEFYYHPLPLTINLIKVRNEKMRLYLHIENNYSNNDINSFNNGVIINTKIQRGQEAKKYDF